jgi:hypothetical protein
MSATVFHVSSSAGRLQFRIQIYFSAHAPDSYSFSFNDPVSSSERVQSDAVMINEQHTKEYVERSGGAIILSTECSLNHSHFNERSS